MEDQGVNDCGQVFGGEYERFHKVEGSLAAPSLQPLGLFHTTFTEVDAFEGHGDADDGNASSADPGGDGGKINSSEDGFHLVFPLSEFSECGEHRTDFQPHHVEPQGQGEPGAVHGGDCFGCNHC